MKIYICILIGLFMSGCAAWTTHNDSIKWSDGTETLVTVSGEGILTAERGDLKVVADHSAGASLAEQVLGVGAAAVIRPGPVLTND